MTTSDHDPGPPQRTGPARQPAPDLPDASATTSPSPAPPPKGPRAARSPISASALAQRQRAERATLPPGFFTSGLSLNELMLVRAAGFEPAGIVMGTSTFPGLTGLTTAQHTFENRRHQAGQELTQPTNTVYRARQLAMRRLVAEARALGADGVVGLRLDTTPRPGSAHTFEFLAMGTAVRGRAGRGARRDIRATPRTPFSSNLSGQDVYALLSAGYRPLSLVMGCSIYCGYQNGRQFFDATGWGATSQNGELESFTDAIYTARGMALNDLREEAAQLRAAGVVGVRVDVQTHLSRHDNEFRQEARRIGKNPAWLWRSLTVGVFIYGTAIAAEDTHEQFAPPRLAITLDRPDVQK